MTTSVPKPRKYPTRGRHYAPAEKADILADAKEMGVADAAKKHGCSPWTIYDWRKKARRLAAREQAETRPPEEPPGPKPEPAESTQQERQRLILECADPR